MNRKLASVQRIVSIQPIEGAEFIEVAQVLGWKVVVKKGEYSVNSLVTYCEIDSFIPQHIAPFLTKEGHEPKNFNGVLGERLRTVKLRGQVSQGLILPAVENYNEGDDVTEVLNIQKYEAPIPANMAGMVRGNFPSFVPKTDEERIQNLPNFVKKYVDTPMFITEKLDGSSATYYLYEDTFGVCSRRLDLKETEGDIWWKMARKYDLEARMRKLGSNFAVQGEIIGPGVQSNRLKLDDLQFFVYNVYDIRVGDYASYEDFINTVAQLGLQTVPILTTDHLLRNSTEFYVEYADGMKSSLNPKVLAEGIVVRPLVEINDDRHGRVSFKAISNKYLLKNGE